MRQLLRAIVAGSAAASLAAACGGDAPKEGFVASSLRDVPADAFDGNVLVTIGDVDVANRLVDAERPDRSDEDGEILDWLRKFEGRDRGDDVSLIWPRRFLGALPSVARDEVGFGLEDVDAFVEGVTLPDHFVILRGVDAADIDDALEERDEGVWQAGESDEPNGEDVSALRPIGSAIYLAQRDGLVIVGEQRDTVEDWLSGEGESLMDDEAIVSVARRLDSAKVYSAVVLARDEPFESPLGEGDGEFAPWSIVAVGLPPGDDRVAVVVYHHDSEADARENVKAIEDEFEDGESFSSGPWSELVEVRSIEVIGADLVVELQQTDRVDTLLTAVFNGEPVLTAGLGR